MNIGTVFIVAGGICGLLACFGVASRVPLTAVGLVFVVVGLLIP